MAALTSDRNAPERLGNLRAGPVAAGARIFAGALIMRTATGHLAPGAAVAGAIGAGRADMAANNTGGAAGAIRVGWRRGVFRFDNSAGADLITIADIGKLCFIVDDRTVAKTDNDGDRSPAGAIDDVDATGVWVRLDESMTRAMLA